MTRNRQWRIARRPNGPVREEDFKWTEGPIPSPAEGQFLVQNLWLSLDPTQILGLAYDGPEPGGIPLGGVMQGLALSRVLESRHPGFVAGDVVYGGSGWEDFSVGDGIGFQNTERVPPGTPPPMALGVLGITGMAAYFGVTALGRPTPGETFVLSGAAGGVGSIAGQIARILGARTVGIAGGAEKCDWLARVARLDGVIDHRSEDVSARLSELCPDGIDVYFDNVGGPLLDEALGRLRLQGRVVVCGGTSRYGAAAPAPGPKNYLNLCLVRGRMEGLLARDYADRFPEARATLRQWIAEGSLTPREDIAHGLANAPRSLLRLFSGENVGKQVLEIDAPPSP